MNLSVGLIGLPRSGKTTVFNALTRSSARVGAFGGQGANVAVVPVPDSRLDFLADLFHPKKVTPATVQYTDIAGLSAASSVPGELGKAVLSSLRDVDALLHVVRAFTGDDGVPADPDSDIEAIDLELTLADLSLVDKRLERLTDTRRRGKPTVDELREEVVMQQLHDALSQGTPIRDVEVSAEDARLLRHYQFLTDRPVLLVLNIAETELPGAAAHSAAVASRYAHQHSLVTAICGKLEMEIAQLDPAEAAEFISTMGLGEPGLNRVLRLSYELLGLVSFLTAGADEVRAWPVRRGSLAPEAAAAVHTDIARGFIRAQVVSFDDLKRLGSMAAAKQAGRLRLEGKQYEVKDGDVIEYLFNI
jgi:ribosome-binding ATPase